jgi:Divergent InlB B-repeat domain
MKQDKSHGFLAVAGKALGLLTLLAASVPMQAQSVTLYGLLSNFDVVNDTGGDVHGFEIEFHGVSGINSYYNWNRYGPPTVTPMPGAAGVYARWMSAYDPASQTFVTGTPMAINPSPMTGHQCVIGTIGYSTSGCEHFGLTTVGNASMIVYHWLIADPANPGQLKTYASQVAIPAPIWSVQPPAQPANPVVVVAIVDPPIPPPPAKLFGDPQWMKTYKTENVRQVNLDELIADNAAVPQDDAHLETAWDLMQTQLGSNSRRKQKQGGLGNGSHAVVRRFEFYKYTGAIDAVTGKALCADVLCLAPGPGEVGGFIGAQNAAANLNVPLTYPVTVTVVGDGQVSNSTSVIRCPGVCTMPVQPNAVVTLTAKNGRGIFSGWTGACTGNSLTCTITVDSDAPTTATFLNPYKLNLRTTGFGTVTTNPPGASFLEGTVITLTAAPAAGNTFTGWTGACSGASLTCTLTMNADAAVTAAFSGAVTPPPPPPPSATYKLVVKLNGNGKVTTNPTGSTFNSGTAVTLTAAPGVGVPWIGWAGACTGTDLTCTVTMNADTTVTANFR